jgi:hypothetical protein
MSPPCQENQHKTQRFPRLPPSQLYLILTTCKPDPIFPPRFIVTGSTGLVGYLFQYSTLKGCPLSSSQLGYRRSFSSLRWASNCPPVANVRQLPTKDNKHELKMEKSYSPIWRGNPRFRRLNEISSSVFKFVRA